VLPGNVTERRFGISIPKLITTFSDECKCRQMQMHFKNKQNRQSNYFAVFIAENVKHRTVVCPSISLSVCSMMEKNHARFEKPARS